MSNLTTNKEKTSPKLAFGYGVGEIGSSISWYMINNYLTLFYTDIVGLSAAAISLIMLIARVWDAVNDPMMGAIADKTNTRWGKFRPYLMFAPPFLAIFNLLTFTVFPVQGAAKVITCLICYIGCGMLYTVVCTAHSALVNVIAIDSQVRMNLATARGIGASVANIVLAAGVMPMILRLGNSNTATAKGYFWTCLILGLVFILCFWIEAVICKETYRDKLHSQMDATAQKKGFIQNVKELCKNDQLLMVVLSTVFGTICVTARMSLLTYYVIYVVGSYELIAPIFTTMTIAQFVGTLTVPYGTKIMGKRNYMLFLTVLMIFGFIAIFFFGGVSTPLLLVLSFICGLCNCASTVCYGMVSDSIEYGAWKLNMRQEGLAGSFLTLGVKIATAICGAVGVLCLEAVGYVPNAEQTEAVKTGINFIVNIIPAICGVISMIPLFLYKLDAKKIADIRSELEDRETK